MSLYISRKILLIPFFWEIIHIYYVMLIDSAIELTCRAPRPSICGAGSTLSEYEIYFNYARTKRPETVAYRPLLWANGPQPGLLFWPTTLESDGPKSNWRGHRQVESKPSIFCRLLRILKVHQVRCFMKWLSHDGTVATTFWPCFSELYLYHRVFMVWGCPEFDSRWVRRAYVC